MTRGMRRRHVVVLFGALAAGAVLAALGASRGSGASPSFERDVAPILQEKCEG